jgi:hypothetical protein
VRVPLAGSMQAREPGRPRWAARARAPLLIGDRPLSSGTGTPGANP